MSNGFLGQPVNRRTFVQGSALATGAFFINTKFSRSMLADVPTSPFTTPWVQPLAFAPYKIPIPFGQQYSTPINEANFQRFDEFRPQKFYEVNVCETMHRAHPQLAFSPHSSYDGMCPGPTFMMRYGEPVFTRINNCMPSVVQGFGSCDVITHVHNGHHAPESDGGPWDLYNPGCCHDHHWPNIYAGGDELEAKGTLFYHDHCHDFTSQNVYRGMAGFFLLFDHRDSGNENDPNPDAFRLPSGVPDGKRVKNRYDIPLVFADRNYDANGMLTMDLMNMDGILGDKHLVNGRVQPYFEVERRKYRFRLLNSGISRYMDLWLSNGMAFQYLANDGNMITKPLTLQNVKLGVAERGDIVVDFSQLPASTTALYLVNRAEQTNGRGPTGNTLPMNQSHQLLKFIIRPETNVPDNSRVPTTLRALPAMDRPVVAERTWHLTRTNGMWTVNGNLFDQNRCDAACKIGTAEIWNFSTAGGWAHPMHNHCEEPRYLTYNGQPVAGTTHEARKDVHGMWPGESMSVYIKFRDWVGKYPMHCHNLIHEDHAMMVRWDIVP